MELKTCQTSWKINKMHNDANNNNSNNNNNIGSYPRS